MNITATKSLSLNAINKNVLTTPTSAAYFKLKDPGSAITHFIGIIYSILLTPVLLIRSSMAGGSLINQIALGVFMWGMVLFYSASTIYHSLDVSPNAELHLKKIDHMMIFVQIAGSYTPFCLNVVGERSGTILLIVVWSLAIAGMIFKFFWVTCPKWISSTIYIGLGWAALFVIPQLWRHLPLFGFLLLVLGGVIYTIGGVIYALKLEVLNEHHPNFGSHEIFHVCVMIGSLFHYLCLFLYGVA